jgi:hypothetical protein
MDDSKFNSVINRKKAQLKRNAVSPSGTSNKKPRLPTSQKSGKFFFSKFLLDMHSKN